MNMLEAVAMWYACPYGLLHCRENECGAYLFVDPRPESSRGTGPFPETFHESGSELPAGLSLNLAILRAKLPDRF